MEKFVINKVYLEDCMTTMSRMPNDFVDLVITSPPYFGCRQYGNETLGREDNPRDYVNNLAIIMSQVKRILKPSGTFYLNIGDVYFGSKGFSRNKGTWERKTDHHYKEHKICKADGKYIQHKQLLLLPGRLAIAMQEDGWVLRNDLIWEKANPLPASARDRRLPCYEHIFHFVKSRTYFFSEPWSKKLKSHRDVIKTGLKPFKDHPAAFVEELIEPLIRVSSRKGGIVYDPFMGSGTTAVVAKKWGRKFIGSEINSDYVAVCERNIKDGVVAPLEEEEMLFEIDESQPDPEHVEDLQKKLGWTWEDKPKV